MRSRFFGFAAAMAVLVAGGVAGAQEEHSACAQRSDANPPTELLGWAQRRDLASAATSADLAKTMLAPGQAVTASLHPTRQVAYVAQPEKPGGSVAYGGMFKVRIAAPGTYRFVLGSGAWIDVLKDGAPVTSSAHAPAPGCTTARKTVEFPLQPGDYVLQVSANAEPTLALMIVQRPRGAAWVFARSSPRARQRSPPSASPQRRLWRPTSGACRPASPRRRFRRTIG